MLTEQSFTNHFNRRSSITLKKMPDDESSNMDVPQVKVLILGDSAVGKSAILHQFINREFSTQYRPTIGADFTCKQVEADNAFITLQIWDTAGQERFRALASSFYRGTAICVFVYDIAAESSFANIEMWHHAFVRQCGPLQDDFPFLLLGNKIDEPSARVVATERGQQFATEHHFLFYEVSAKSCENIAVAFQAVVRKLIASAKAVEERGFAAVATVDDSIYAAPRQWLCPC
jgi:small GTP-binding protein